jgi:hypothetical protein
MQRSIGSRWRSSPDWNTRQQWQGTMTGIPTTGNTIELTSWQKKQAAMLYYFSSEEYLRTLHHMVRDLVNGVVEPVLDMARAQGRDRVVANAVWGARDTSDNWANNGWPILKDLQISLARTLARRVSNHFRISAVNECLRGIQEYSLAWMTPGEEEMFSMALRTISEFASGWDTTVTDYANNWDDYGFAYEYPAFASRNDRIPKFKVRPDIQAITGDIPARTGVYFSPDDPNISLQFAWAEHGGLKLRSANTFNQLGLAALAAVGRDALWLDEEKMLAFVLSNPLAQPMRDEVIICGELAPALAPSAVGRAAFTTKSCSWMLVEPIPGEFDELRSLTEQPQQIAVESKRIAGGALCDEAGFYFTPSAQNSRRYFAKGDRMPALSSVYGETIWQWDEHQ